MEKTKHLICESENGEYKIQFACDKDTNKIQLVVDENTSFTFKGGDIYKLLNFIIVNREDSWLGFFLNIGEMHEIEVSFLRKWEKVYKNDISEKLINYSKENLNNLNERQKLLSEYIQKIVTTP